LLACLLACLLRSDTLLVPELIDEGAWEHGELQEKSCRNGFFAVLFLLQVALVLTLAVMGMVAFGGGDYSIHGDDVHVTRGLVFLIVITLSVVVLSAGLMMLLLGALAEMMIQVSLVISPLSCGLGSIVALVFGQVIMAIMLAVFCMFGTCYAVHVWHRIPFSAANMATAMAAIKANRGVLGLAYGMTFLTMIWTLVWTFAVGQVTIVESNWVMNCTSSTTTTSIMDYYYFDDRDDDDPECHLSTQGKWILVGLVFCFYWTSQVIKNIFHTTTAGVVGTWWFAPGDAGNAALYDSWVRSTVYSLGSICLGSFLVAIVQVLQFLVQVARQQRDEDGRQRRQSSLLWCLLQFLVDQLERLVEYVNQWAFGTYVVGGGGGCQ
jgi:hypothetical protein